MRNILAITLVIVLPIVSRAQRAPTLSSVCIEVSKQWKLDSSSCKGDRLMLSRLLSKAEPDSITKKFLLSMLGEPNITQKSYAGYPDNKSYVEYIYYTYKDDCPQIHAEGAGIGFVFDESETRFIRIQGHEYCG